MKTQNDFQQYSDKAQVQLGLIDEKVEREAFIKILTIQNDALDEKVKTLEFVKSKLQETSKLMKNKFAEAFKATKDMLKGLKSLRKKNRNLQRH